MAQTQLQKSSYRSLPLCVDLLIYFAVLEEIYNNVVPHWSAFLISCNHSITRLISFTKNTSNQRSILSVYGPSECLCVGGRVACFIPPPPLTNRFCNNLCKDDSALFSRSLHGGEIFLTEVDVYDYFKP
jgi:hypothetical protein